MPVRDAARVDDPIGHDSMLGTFLKKGSGLVAGLITGAVAVGVRAGLKLLAGTVTVGSFGLGVGIGVGLLALDYAIGKSGIFEKFHNFLDSGMKSMAEKFCPPKIKGKISTGSPNVHINKKNAALTIKSLAVCADHSAPVAAEGSGTVHINQELLHRKGDKLNCGAVTAEASPNVHVGGETVAMCEIKESWLEKVLEHSDIIVLVATSLFSFKARGKLCKKIVCAGLNIGMDVAQTYILTSVGGPVNTLSGAKFLDGDEDIDFTLPSALPIKWARSYYSLDRDESGPFGPGWSLDYTLQLKVNQPGDFPIIVPSLNGRELMFPEIKRGRRLLATDEVLGLSRTEGGQYILDDRDGTFYSFVTESGEVCPADGSPQTLRLDSIEDRNGNRISLRYADNGRLCALADSAGHLVECLPHARFPERIGAMRVCDFDHGGLGQNWRALAEYEYDDKARLVSVTNALGEETRRFSWHDSGPGEGLMASHSFQSGLSCFYEWAEAPDHPRVSRHWISDGRAWNLSYTFHEGGGGSTTAVDVLGHSQHWEWGAEYRLLSHTNEVGDAWRVEWNDNDRPVKVELPTGGVHEIEYDEYGLVTAQIDPFGNKESFTWDTKLETIISESDQVGHTWQYEYDSRGNLIAATDPNGALTVYSRDRRGRLIGQTDANGKLTTLDYDRHDLLTRHMDCVGNVTEYEYDENGLETLETDALSQHTQTSRDALGRAMGLKLPDDAVYKYEWNKQGLFSKSTDPEGGVFQLQYNKHGQLTAQVNELGHSLKYAYDRRGDLTSLTNENGESYQFEYDPAGRQKSQIGLDGLVTAYELNELGLPVAVRRAAQTSDEIEIKLERDLSGKLVRKITPEYITDYSYDPRGFLTLINRVESNGNFVDSIEFKYDFNGNIIEEKTTEALTSKAVRETSVKYEYDLLGRLIRTVLPDGRSLVSDLGACGHEARVSLADKNGANETLLAAFHRDALHRESERVQGRQQVVSQYDPLSRLKSRANRRRPDLIDSLGELIQVEKTYAYDKNGELTASRDSFSGQRQYKYDAAGRLTSSAAVGRVSSEFERLGRSNSAARQAAKKLLSEERFTYDAASNLMATGTDGGGLTIRPTRPEDFGGISPSRDGRAASFVKHNRLTAFEGFSFKYDRLGRTVEKTHLDTNRKWRFTYNSEDQLISVQTVKGSSMGLIRFKYDALGRRISKTDGRKKTRFTWSMMRLLEERSSDTKSIYVYEQGGYVPLARIDTPNEDWYAAEGLLLPKDINAIYYFHNNASGQPEEMTDRDGNVVWRGRYSAWGQLLYEEAPHGFVQNLRMQGQYHDREIGLHYNTFRYYDADTGRFTTEDPIGLLGGINLYQYAPNPIAWIDPWGWHLNSNTATGNFGVYEIRIDGELHKVGKADLDRVTKSTGQPTRLHQQIQKLQKNNPGKIVTGDVVERGHTTTKDAKAAETRRLDKVHNKTGKVPEGNQKSYKPSKTSGNSKKGGC